MSGGSWNYMHSEWQDFYLGSRFEEVAERLKGTPAESEARHIAGLMTQAVKRWEGLSKVLKTMEWVDSGDSAPEDLEEAIREWAANRKPKKSDLESVLGDAVLERGVDLERLRALQKLILAHGCWACTEATSRERSHFHHHSDRASAFYNMANEPTARRALLELLKLVLSGP